MKTMKGLYLLITAAFISACEIVDNITGIQSDTTDLYVGLDQVAEILSLLPLQHEHLQEVYNAVTASSCNGYDEEYTMKNLFESPGTGVGDSGKYSKTASSRPLRTLIEEHIRQRSVTKSDNIDPDVFLNALSSSDLQIYWPYSEEWDGETLPIITFDPEDGAEKNIGYRLVSCDDGSHRVDMVVVDEEMAESVPVWVVNRNSDAGYTSLEMLRKEDPDWGEGGGTVIIRPVAAHAVQLHQSKQPYKSLVLKDFTMNRNYDTWFAGASEFVKVGYIDDFTAVTEAELKLFNPLVTDFMVVVKRKQVGIPQQLNVLMMSDWSSQMTSCAFMITEDDGGTQTEWTCKAKVYVASKSYGIEINLPIKTRDDIVWRGELANHWIEDNESRTWAFGDVDLTFELFESQASLTDISHAVQSK